MTGGNRPKVDVYDDAKYVMNGGKLYDAMSTPR
jgi:hypothetical protein